MNEYNEYSADWKSYQTGLAYQARINLLSQTDKNYRFYGNEHWKGVKGAEKLTLAVIPITQQIVDLKVAVVMSDSLAMKFTVQGVADDTQDPMEQEYRQMAQQLSDYSQTMWENLKLDFMNENGLLDSAITADMISFWYWNELIDAGNGAMGDLCGELIDNVNFFPGDPNLDQINDAYGPVQPSIILSFLSQVEDEKRIAKANGASKDDLDKIIADAEAQQNQSGDAAKQKPDGNSGKCIVLLKLWKVLEEGKWHIMARRSTKDLVTRKEWDTELHRYPVAMMHWRKKKGSTYGDAEVTHLIKNQLTINKLASLIATWITLHGFPRLLFDTTRIKSISNDLSQTIGVNGTDTGGVGGAAMYMVPANLSSAVQNFMIWFIETTKKSFGANEAILGEAPGTNYSANMLNSQNAIVPLNGQKHRFYNYVEDIGLIWLDFWLSKYKEYPDRKLEIMKNKTKTVVPFDANKLKGVKLKLKINVGPSTQWNQAAVNQRLDNLLKDNWITFVEYLERISDDSVPDSDSLIATRDAQKNAQENADKQLLYELMARFLDTVSPEIQKQLDEMKQNNPEQYEQQVRQLIQQTPAQQIEQPKGPSESINFKDLPPEGQVQMAGQAGIQLTPQAIAQNQATQQAQKEKLKAQGGKQNAVSNMQK